MFLEMKHISMQFGSALALDDVTFSMDRGEIHGLMGENGAGKSTLMNILGGVHTPASGRVVFNGTDITGFNEKKTALCGIRFIHQELNLINDLKVYENLFLGDEIMGAHNMMIDRNAMRKRAAEVLKRVHLADLNPDAEVGPLDTSQKQLLEIAKALLFHAKLIIMDEPTTALSDQEIQNLFDIMHELKAEGVSMIYISHKMPELFAICDRYTILRDGQFIASGFFQDIDESQATTLLVGQHVSDIIEKKSNVGAVILRAEAISCDKYFQNVSFELHKGEVLVFSGLQGDGRGELAEALFGARKLTSGTVYLEGQPIHFKSIAQVMRSGISMVQRNRKERSIIKNMSILDNLKIAEYVQSKTEYVIRRKKQFKDYARCKAVLSIKAENPK
ncbi:MAG: sugar ABC transporter ATP-binding protein, partial [Clostridia bacterium]